MLSLAAAGTDHRHPHPTRLATQPRSRSSGSARPRQRKKHGTGCGCRARARARCRSTGPASPGPRRPSTAPGARSREDHQRHHHGGEAVDSGAKDNPHESHSTQHPSATVAVRSSDAGATEPPAPPLVPAGRAPRPASRSDRRDSATGPRRPRPDFDSRYGQSSSTAGTDPTSHGATNSHARPRRSGTAVHNHTRPEAAHPRGQPLQGCSDPCTPSLQPGVFHQDHEQ